MRKDNWKIDSIPEAFKSQSPSEEELLKFSPFKNKLILYEIEMFIVCFVQFDFAGDDFAWANV
jgi:hypothetical protein